MITFHAGVALAATLVLTGATIIARACPGTPHGLDREPPVRQVLDEVSLDELLGPWPEPARGTHVTWAFRMCPSSGLDEPHALHDDGSHTCSCCFTTTPHGARS